MRKSFEWSGGLESGVRRDHLNSERVRIRTLVDLADLEIQKDPLD